MSVKLLQDVPALDSPCILLSSEYKFIDHVPATAEELKRYNNGIPGIRLY
ncbi:MAG TPA: hypothetical protein VMW67_04485 [Desulfobacteria bacterium]|nr:hypothetical protein [Desulfobacteria bacterium]